MACLIGTVAYLVINDDKCDYASTNFCSKECPPKNIVAIGVDASGGFDARQQAALMSSIRRAISTVPGSEYASTGTGLSKGDRIDIYNLQAAADEAIAPLLSICFPGQEPTSANDNAQLVRSYHNRFWQEVTQVISDGLKAEAVNQSPIAESIASIGDVAFRSADAMSSKYMIIVSDLLQNSPAFSVYRESPDFSALKKRPEYVKLRTDLGGAKVCMIRISRSDALERARQTPRLLNFWAEYVADNLGEYVVECETQYRL